MSKTLKIDPLTRIEGHLKIETTIENGSIVDARVGGQMFRGLEKILLDRHPFDAARITQRICGVCHEVHGVASTLALENLYGIESPYNGKILRDLILGLHLVGDHIFHFYQLCLPDYVDFSHIKNYQGKDNRIIELSNWLGSTKTSFFSRESSDHYLKDKDQSIEMTLSYFEAMQIRRETASGLAILGGKVPFAQALMPGGLTTQITSGKLMRFFQALQKTCEFVENSYLPQVEALAKYFPDYFSVGLTDCALLSHEAFQLLEQPLFKSGVLSSGKTTVFDPGMISEKVDRSFFDDDGKVSPEKSSAYSWIKVPHYADRIAEVGPFARLIINGDDAFVKLLHSCGQKTPRSSVMSRLLARAYESEIICKHLHSLLENFQIGEPTIVPVDLDKKPTGSGNGYSIAARGALSHEIHAVNGKVTHYRMLVPSAWNFGPTAGKNKGVAESALIGTSIGTAKSSESLIAGRIIRSFDPCIACAVH